MNTGSYRLAGWLALAQGVLFPAGIVVGIIQGVISKKFFDLPSPALGPSDLILAVFTLFSVYTLFRLRGLLKDRYNFHDADNIILIIIGFSVITEIVNLAIRAAMLLTGGPPAVPVLIVIGSLAAIALITSGVLDLFLALKLIRLKDRATDAMKIYTYLTFALGGLCVTLILSFLALVIVPISCLVLALIFFRAGEESQYV